MRRKFVECPLSIDKAKNNTSIVCCLEWKGWKLLFTGDAEIKSWKIMRDKGVLNPVHFLKVSHHGSHNGTPSENIMEIILPKQNGQRRKLRAVVSTWKDTYKGVPDPDTLERIYDPQIKLSQRRCDKLYLVNESIPTKLYIYLFFSPQRDI